jgi:hypothetical protein
VGELVTIAGTEFHVFDIPDATHIYLTPTTDPTAIQTYGVGSALCSASCCEILDDRLTIIENYVLNNLITDGCTDPVNQWLAASANFADADPIAGPINIAAGDTADGNIATLSFQNVSCKNTMGVIVNFHGEISADTNGATDDDAANVVPILNIVFGVAPAGALFPIYNANATVTYETVAGQGAGIARHVWYMSSSVTFTLAPGETGEIKAQAQLAYSNGGIPSFDVQELASRISYLAVAVA